MSINLVTFVAHCLLDIERINKAIENIRQPLDRQRKEEDVIRAGYLRVLLRDTVTHLNADIA